MNQTEAVGLLDELASVYRTTLSDPEKRVYLQRLRFMQFDSARVAVDKLIDTREYFPRPAAVVAFYHAALGEIRAAPRPSALSQPMTPTERRETAAVLATEASVRLERHHGQRDAIGKLLSGLSETYETNATLQERGEKLLPLPKLSEIIRAVAGPPNPARGGGKRSHPKGRDTLPNCPNSPEGAV